MPPAFDYSPKPTNSTKVSDGQIKGNRDEDILLYILIVVGASVFLLSIPLINYVVRWFKKKSRRRRRRKQAEKAHARVMAEKEIIEKRMYENQLAKQQAAKPPPLEINGQTTELGIPPRSPVSQENQLTPSSVSPPPRSPLHSDNEVLIEKMAASDLDVNGFRKENGHVNKGFTSSNSILSIPMRKSTSDMYLPQDTSIIQNAKRRLSEDLIGQRDDVSLQELLTKEILHRAEQNNQADADDGIARKESDSQVGNGDLRNPAPKSSPPLSGKSSQNHKPENAVCEDNDSDDYDDVYDDIYENVDRNELDSDGPIYDNIDIIGSDVDHIYSNVDCCSDTGSHIYTNVDGSICESDSKETGDYDSGEDAYENINFVYRKKRRSLESSGADDESDASSVSYENIWEDEDSEREREDAEGHPDKPPIIIPRRIPIDQGNDVRTNDIKTNGVYDKARKTVS